MTEIFRYEVTVRDRVTGEERTWCMTHMTLKTLVRALRAYKSAPKYLADRFTFPPPRGGQR